MANAILQTEIPNITATHGKVRDIYDLGEQLLIVASDRISAFDVIMTSPIPYKGIVLTQISKFWFDFLADTVENHLISTNVGDFPATFRPHADQLTGRTMLVKAFLVSAGFVFVSRPEPGGIGGQDLVNQDNFAVGNAPLKFCVGQDDAPRLGVGGGLSEYLGAFVTDVVGGFCADHVNAIFEADVLIVLAYFGLGGGCENQFG